MAVKKRTAGGQTSAALLPPQPNLPLFGIAGYSGSGKTALLDALLPRLRRKGLAVAVIKHDIHGLGVDHPGKDSDRLFRSGADVLVQGPEETFFRIHSPTGRESAPFPASAFLRYDLVLAEGWKAAAIPKVWLLKRGENAPPSDMTGLLAALPPESDRLAAVAALLDRWLSSQWLKTPVFGCILLGDRNDRAGMLKCRTCKQRKRQLERTTELLRSVTDCVVVAGPGRVPDGLEGIPRLPDAPGIQGPMAAMLSATRWAPHVSWLIAAYDLPYLSLDLLQRLLSTRTPGVWATMLKLPDHAGMEPVLAHYDFRARVLVEDLLAAQDFQLHHLLQSSKVVAQSLDASCGKDR
jgi:molybdopterin-guanine dinucleotide biosynthesis protein MobB